MVVHRAIATSFKEPSVDMSLDMRLTLSAQAQKGILHTISRRIDIPVQQSQGVSNQRTLQPFKRRLEPRLMRLGRLVQCFSLHHVGSIVVVIRVLSAILEEDFRLNVAR